MSTDAILAQFNDAAENYRFPNLDNGYVYPTDTRMHLMRDETRWALVVELVGFNYRAANLVDVLHTFGNCLTSGRPGTDNNDFHDRLDNAEQVSDPELGYVGDVPLQIRGRSMEVDTRAGQPMWDVCRLLVPAHRDLLLADEHEVRSRVPLDLPVILRLEEWHQADLFENLPSETETFRQIAEVLATGDATRYRPTMPPNTHWSNWPEAGEL
ncbi:hypothetical protein IMZ11_25330 [Microtetraspora sp. AC03309]|nr:hypothetical protein [Microtetraspora sp. AC03309]